MMGFPGSANAEEPACQFNKGGEDPLEKEMATLSSILTWRIPLTEEPGGVQFMGSQRVGLLKGLSTHTHNVHDKSLL